MANYRVLERDEAEGEGFEIRKYPPAKRTISVCGRTYFLPFPYIVFGFFWTPRYTCLSTAFAKDSDSIFFPCLPNVHNNYIVCLGGGWHEEDWTSHFSHDPKYTCDELISRFWQSDFHDIREWDYGSDAIDASYLSFHNWARLSPDDVMSRLSFGEEHWHKFFDSVVDGLEFAEDWG